MDDCLPGGWGGGRGGGKEGGGKAVVMSDCERMKESREIKI